MELLRSSFVQFALLHLMLGKSLSSASAKAQYCRCIDPSDSCWPAFDAWKHLNETVRGRLIIPESPLSSCRSGESAECREELRRTMETPFWDQHFAGGSFYTGWYGAWTPALSVYAVAATCIADIQAAVTFAAKYRLRLVVKGTGSDYLGRSSAPGSLLVWTHAMQQISWSGDNTSVTVEAGVRWGDVYDQAQARGRFVPGGQCPNVGAAGGYSLGGGWSPLSRLYGTISHSLIEATIIKADGEVVLATPDQNSDIFWALRGGGGGTFGIVANLTFRAWPAPAQVSYLAGSISCPDEAGLQNVTEAFLSLYPSIAPEHWSDKVFWKRFSLGFKLFFPGLGAKEVQHAFAPFQESVRRSGCRTTQPLAFHDVPSVRSSIGTEIARLYPYPWASTASGGAPGLDNHWYDKGDQHQYFAYYTTRYVPQSDFARPSLLTAKLMSLLRFAGSENGTVGFLLQFNKALGGTNVVREEIPAPHPSAYDAAAFLDYGWTAHGYFPQFPENRDTLSALHDTLEANCDQALGKDKQCLLARNLTEDEVGACFSSFRECISQAAKKNNPSELLDDLFPGMGTYVNEANFFEASWQDKFWGRHYARLRKIKDAVDPSGLFVCHHCVGSEDWSSDGNCRLQDETYIV